MDPFLRYLVHLSVLMFLFLAGAFFPAEPK